MKKTFIFYNDWEDYTEEMSLEEKWLFLQTILDYQRWKELWNIEKIKFIRSRVKKQLDYDNAKWEDELKKRSLAWIKWNKKRWWDKTKKKDNRKSSQVIASAINSSQVIAVNVNDNVNNNNKDNNNNKEIDNSKLLSIEQAHIFWNQDINYLIENLKKLSNELWIIYDKKNDRNFAKHILTSKDFWDFASNIWQNRIEFAKNILLASVKINYWKWPCSWPMKIYQNYWDVYNQTKLLNKKEAEKQKKNTIESF